MAKQDEQIHLLGPHPDDEQEEETTTVNGTPAQHDTTVQSTVEVDEEEEEEETLEDYAGMVVTIFKPVAITMLLVVWAVRTINVHDLGGQRYGRGG
jgi:heme/copper-type cytochrome/quinol oxidase subunit 2